MKHLFPLGLGLLVAATSGCTALDLWDGPVLDVEVRSCNDNSDCDTITVNVLNDDLAKNTCIEVHRACDFSRSQCTASLGVRDSDDDGFRDIACENAAGLDRYAPLETDCNDSDPFAKPGIDSDHDGYVHAGCPRADGSFGLGEDCNDQRYTIHPGAEEACDGFVSACVGTAAPAVRVGEDDDGDGHSPIGVMGCVDVSEGTVLKSYLRDDCDDTDQFVYAGAPDVCDGRQNDCNLNTDPDPAEDQDGDGFAPLASSGVSACNASLEGSFPTTDCDDTNEHTYPGAPEFCDGLINDCTARTGTNFARPIEDPDGDGFYAGNAACTGAIGSIECNGSATDVSTRQCPPRVESAVFSGMSPRYTRILTGDVDGADGIAEIVAMTSDMLTVDVFRSTTGNWPALATVSTTLSAAIRDMALVPLSPGGTPQLLVSTSAVGIETRTFVSATGFGAAANVVNSATAAGAFGTGDVDGDGYTDVVFVTATSSIEWIEAVPNGATTSGTIDAGPIASAANRIVVADLNGDGFDDVVTMSTSTANLVAYRTTAAATFGAAASLGATSVGNSANVVAGDFEGDGDGDIDLVVLGQSGLALLAQRSAGVFTPVALTPAPPTGGSNPWPIASADLDRDGSNELLIANSDTDTVSYFDEVGSGLFAHDIVSDFASVVSVGAGDLDADGDLDVVGGALSGISMWRSVFLSNATFTPHNVDRAFGGAFGISIVDVDGDAHRDIVAMSATAGDKQVTVWRSRDASASSFDERPLLPLNNTLEPTGFAVADVTGVSALDIVLALDDTSASTDVIRIRTGRTDGGFDPLADVGQVDKPTGIATANLEGTSRAEIVVATSGTGAALTVFQANTAGSAFDTHVIEPASLSCTATAVGDLDGDGDVDIAVACGLNQLRVYRNPGSLAASWPMVQLGAGGKNYGRVVIADMNGNGQDEIVATTTAGVIEWLELDSAGAIASRRSIPAGLAVVLAPPIAIGDLDRDGDADMVVGGSTELRFIQCTNAARGRYVNQPLASGHSNTRSVSVGDLDSDGSPDVAAAILTDGDVIWWSSGGTPWWNH